MADSNGRRHSGQAREGAPPRLPWPPAAACSCCAAAHRSTHCSGGCKAERSEWEWRSAHCPMPTQPALHKHRGKAASRPTGRGSPAGGSGESSHLRTLLQSCPARLGRWGRCRRLPSPCRLQERRVWVAAEWAEGAGHASSYGRLGRAAGVAGNRCALTLAGLASAARRPQLT